ncbi:MAG: methionine aminotransferase [Cyclobacteriaceae bacterium]
MNISSKLPFSGPTIFSTMSVLATTHKAINLGQGFPDFDTDQVLLDLITKHLNQGKNQYCPMAGLPALRQTLSEKINRCYGMKINPETQLCITAGATQALFTAINAFIRPGDEVIILEPAYDCYKPEVLIAGGIPRAYSMVYPDYAIDWNEIREMVNEKTKMIIINTPHNPSGTLLTSNDMQQLEQIVSGKDIVVLSDEVYEHLIYDGEEHQSVMRFPNLFQQSIAVFSFGKTLHATGWKMGYVVGAEALVNEFKAIHQWNVFCVNSFIQFAIAEYLQNPETYEQLPSFFEQKRNQLTELLENVPMKPLISKGTYFQLYNYEEISQQDDVTFAKYLTSEIGVAAIPMSPFYSTDPGDKTVRLCFAKKSETLELAAERLQKLKS